MLAYRLRTVLRMNEPRLRMKQKFFLKLFEARATDPTLACMKTRQKGSI